MKDYYRVLNTAKNATDVEIKKSFRALASTLHPDKNKQPDAHDRFIEINEAYQILSDPAKRKRYDSVYNSLVLNKTRAKNQNVTDVEDFKAWAEDGRNKGRRYAKNSFADFVTDAFMDSGTTVFLDGISDGLGSLMDGASDVLGDLLDITD